MPGVLSAGLCPHGEEEEEKVRERRLKDKNIKKDWNEMQRREVGALNVCCSYPSRHLPAK